MGMLHLYLLVMFSTFLSVRSCDLNTIGKKWWSGRTIGGKLIFPTSNVVDLSNTAIVLKLPPVGERKFHNKWTAGIIRFGRTGCKRKFCPTDDTMIPCPGRGGVSCPADENDMSMTSGTTPTTTVTLTTLSTSTLDVTSTSPENDMSTTSETAPTTTVTLTTPSRSTLDVTSTSPELNVTSVWNVTTGSKVRGQAYVRIKYTIDEDVCGRQLDYTLTLRRDEKDKCNTSRDELLLKTCGDDCNDKKPTEKIFRGLQPDANYKVILKVNCSKSHKYHRISDDKHTAESVPTAAPMNITAKSKGAFLIFRWDEPPCHGKNGNITNYDFIFIKTRGATKNKIHNVTPRKIVVFNGMEDVNEYGFKVRANTKRGFGVYSDLCHGFFANGGVTNNCTNPEDVTNGSKN